MKNKKILKISIFLLVLFGITSVVFASVTISNTGITGNTAFNSIGGNLADTTIDVGTGKILSLQTLNNGPVTIGSGLVTLGGNLTVAGLGGSGTKCLHVSNTGIISTAAADCGSGGGGSTPGGSSGQVQVNSSNSFAGQSSIFSGGSLVQRAVECSSGTVSHTALTAAAANQEITIQTGMSGDVRYDQVMVSETTQFAGGTGLTVSMGRPGSNNYEMTGTLFPLQVSSGDTNSWTSRPVPPQLTSTYSIVLNFAVTSGNVNTVNAGVLTWEICGYKAR
jgi:hypothetical protein